MSLMRFQEKLNVPQSGILDETTLNTGKLYFGLSVLRTAHFFGQCAHESNNFNTLEENLNYNEIGLLKTFPHHFDQTTAAQYAHQPQKIANHVYANRMGNGDEFSGDGWKYRGRGVIQITGRSDYSKLSIYMSNPDVLDHPEYVATEYFFNSALFYFSDRKIWEICDRGIDLETITKVTEKINGGTNGLQSRIVKTQSFFKLLK